MSYAIKLLVISLFLFTVVSSQTNGVLREYWLNIAGSDLTDLKNSTLFPCSPSGKTIESSFKIPINWADSYGSRMRGFIKPPTSGNYTFWICGDDNCELWLSTDNNTANKQLIAKTPTWTYENEWTKFPEQQSVAIYLEADKLYYIEALHKDGGGNDNMAVGWQLPDGSQERPIGNNRLFLWPDNEDYTTWSYFTPVIINTSNSGVPISEELVDFPLLIRLNQNNSTIFNQTIAGGDDIRFADQNGQHLNYEIEEWNTTLKIASIWIKIPKILVNTAQYRVKMYWGKSSVFPISDGSMVFNKANNYAAEYHFNDNSSNSAIKSSTDFLNGVLQKLGASENSINQHTDGIISGGLIFQGQNRVQLTNFTPVQSGGDFSMSMWTFANQTTGTLNLWYTNEGSGFGKIKLSKGTNWLYENGTSTTTAQVSSTSTTGQWVLLSLNQKVGQNIELYVNGNLMGSSNFQTTGQRTSTSYIGAEEAANYFIGKIDDVSFSTTVRNQNWIKMIYENQKIDQKLVTIGEPALLTPTNFAAVCINDSEIKLTWNDNTSNETKFIITKWTGTSLPIQVAILPTNITSYIDVIGLCGKKFKYSIKAANDFAESGTVESNEIYTIPCKPTSFTITQQSQSDIKLTWGGDMSDFVLEGRPFSQATYNELYHGTNMEFVQQGIACNAIYFYRIKAVNTTGSSDWFEKSITSTACLILPPTNLVANNSTSEVILTWNDASNNEDGFEIFRKKISDGSFQMIGTAFSSGGMTVTYTDKIVECNTTYLYYVVAYNSNSRSGASNNINIATLYCGAGKSTSEMITINGIFMLSGQPVTGNKLAVVKLYKSIDISGQPLFEEFFPDVTIKNGYFAIPLGLTKDVMEVIKENRSLYYDVIIDGLSIFQSKAQLLTGCPYSVKSLFNLSGIESPITNGIIAPLGATYVDTQNKILYVKYGALNTEWRQIGN